MILLLRHIRSYISRSLRTTLKIYCALLLSAATLSAQCPNAGQTKVLKPSKGTGFYFYKFLGDGSFRYFLDGASFSFNEKDHPGKTFVFIDDFAYESLLVDLTDVANYAQGSKPLDLLTAQAKHQQEYFKKFVPSVLIKDYGPSARKNPDGSDGRLFYLWKKENSPGPETATQYLVSTLVDKGVVVLSIMLTKKSLTEEDAFLQIEKYTSRFDLISQATCAKVLAAPTTP